MHAVTTVMLCYRTLLEKSRGVPRRRARWQASKTSADFYRPARRSDPLTMNFRNGCSHAVGWRFNVGNLEIRINFRQWTAQMVHFRKMTRIRVIIRHPMCVLTPPWRARSGYNLRPQRGQKSLPAVYSVYSREREDELLSGPLYSLRCALSYLVLPLSFRLCSTPCTLPAPNAHISFL